MKINKIEKRLSQDESRLFCQLYELSFDGLSCILYREGLNKHEKQYDDSKNKEWFHFTRNAYLDEVVLRWCMVFASWREPTHYYNLLETNYIKSTLESLNIQSQENLKSYLLKKADIPASEFETYHETTKDYRDRYLVHREFSHKTINDGELSHPRLILARKLFSALIEFLCILGNKLPNTKGSYPLSYHDNDISELENYIIQSMPTININ